MMCVGYYDEIQSLRHAHTTTTESNKVFFSVGDYLAIPALVFKLHAIQILMYWKHPRENVLVHNIVLLVAEGNCGDRPYSYCR